MSKKMLERAVGRRWARKCEGIKEKTEGWLGGISLGLLKASKCVYFNWKKII